MLVMVDVGVFDVLLMHPKPSLLFTVLLSQLAALLVMMVATSGTSLAAAVAERRVCLSRRTWLCSFSLRSKPSLVHAFAVLACYDAGYTGSVGNIKASCNGTKACNQLARENQQFGSSLDSCCNGGSVCEFVGCSHSSCPVPSPGLPVSCFPITEAPSQAYTCPAAPASAPLDALHFDAVACHADPLDAAACQAAATAHGVQFFDMTGKYGAENHPGGCFLNFKMDAEGRRQLLHVMYNGSRSVGMEWRCGCGV